MADVKPSLNRKTSEIIIVTAIAIVIASFVYFGVSWLGNFSGIKVPDELVLGERVQAQGKFADLNPASYDSVMYNTPKTEEELISFYSSKLVDEGWTIYMNRRLQNGNYLINAQKGVTQLDVTIFNEHLAGANTTLVSLVYQDRSKTK